LSKTPLTVLKPLTNPLSAKLFRKGRIRLPPQACAARRGTLPMPAGRGAANCPGGKVCITALSLFSVAASG